MVRIELEKNLYVVIGGTYKIRTSFETAMGGRYTQSDVGIISGIVDQDLILARGAVAQSRLTCWGGYETLISSFQDQKIQLKDIESIVKRR